MERIKLTVQLLPENQEGITDAVVWSMYAYQLQEHADKMRLPGAETRFKFNETCTQVEVEYNDESI